MITSYLANVTEANYEAFRRVVKDVPATFKEFAHLRMQTTVDLESKGHTVITVDLDPSKFTDYCRTTNSPNNLHTLDSFAFETGEWEKK